MIVHDPSRRPISFFIPALNGGGAQRVVVNLVNALVELTDRPIHVVLVRREGPFLRDLRQEIEVVELKGSRTLAAIPSLARYLRRERPVVMMSSMNYANVAAVIAHHLAGRPCRLVLREAGVLAPEAGRSTLRLRVLVSLMSLCYRRADSVISNSQDTLRSLEVAGVNLPASTPVIGNPVALPALQQECEWEGPKDVPYVCAVGRLVPQKGFDILLQAVANIDRPDVHIVILGDGPLREVLKEQARQLGLTDRLHLPGFINPPTTVFQNAQLFVLSSRSEGFGNVLVEALAVGVPIVSTNCPGGPREILDNGRFGRLVPVDDADALAEAIILTLKDPVASRDERIDRAKIYAPMAIAEEYLARALLNTSK